MLVAPVVYQEEDAVKSGSFFPTETRRLIVPQYAQYYCGGTEARIVLFYFSYYFFK
jgi:hypothetical protein